MHFGCLDDRAGGLLPAKCGTGKHSGCKFGNTTTSPPCRLARLRPRLVSAAVALRYTSVASRGQAGCWNQMTTAVPQVAFAGPITGQCRPWQIISLSYPLSVSTASGPLSCRFVTSPQAATFRASPAVNAVSIGRPTALPRRWIVLVSTYSERPPHRTSKPPSIATGGWRLPTCSR